MKPRSIVIGIVVGTLLTLTISVLAGRWVPPGSRTTVPYLIPYQGVLERNGQLVNALDSDTVTFRVSLWDADDVRVWPEDDQGYEYEEHSVNVYSGRFALNIGSVVPYRHIADTDLYLDIQVMGPDDDSFVQLGERQRFLSSPFAVAAERSDIDFYVPGKLGVGTDTPDRELDVQGAARAADLTVTGSTGLEGAVTVGGDMQTNALLDVLGDLHVDGLRPFMWRQYHRTVAEVTYNTGVSTDDWWAVIAGFHAWNGDVYEDGTHDPILCRMVQSAGSWWIQKDFVSHNTHEKWTVDVLFIRRKLVDAQ